MKKQQLTSFYLEALLLIVVFVAMILVLTGVFGASRARSAEARQLTNAVMLASNAAEAVAAADSAEAVAALLDENGNARLSADGVTAGYALDGSPSADAEPALSLRVSWEPDEDDSALVRSRILVCRAGEETPIYTLETATIVREAGA